LTIASPIPIFFINAVDGEEAKAGEKSGNLWSVERKVLYTAFHTQKNNYLSARIFREFPAPTYAILHQRGKTKLQSTTRRDRKSRCQCAVKDGVFRRLCM